MSALTLYGHPFSSYTWKALIALYEKELPFKMVSVEDDVAANQEPGGRLITLWPPNKFPVLEDGDKVLIESSIVIEHLDLAYPDTTRLLPADPAEALHVRFMDRVFDNHVMANMQSVVGEHLPFITAAPDPMRIDRAKAALATIYAWLEKQLPDDGWVCGDAFTLADCAAAPALFYADWVLPIPDDCPRVQAYRARALARPSVARAVDGGRPYRHYWVLGPTDRD
jgi:glutathione S-transferase